MIYVVMFVNYVMCNIKWDTNDHVAGNWQVPHYGSWKVYTVLRSDYWVASRPVSNLGFQKMVKPVYLLPRTTFWYYLITTILKKMVGFGMIYYYLVFFMYFKAAEKEFKMWKPRLKRTFCSRSSSVVMMPKETRSIFARQCGSNRESQDSETMGQGTARERRNRGRFLVETASDHLGIRDDYWLVVELPTPLKNDGVRQWEGWHPIHMLENNKCLKPPTRLYNDDSSQIFECFLQNH